MQNVQVANLEEIAYRMGYITKEQVHELARSHWKRMNTATISCAWLEKNKKMSEQFLIRN